MPTVAELIDAAWDQGRDGEMGEITVLEAVALDAEIRRLREDMHNLLVERDTAVSQARTLTADINAMTAEVTRSQRCCCALGRMVHAGRCDCCGRPE